VGAARGAHPYEEPLITVAEVEIGRSSARMGMLNRAPEGLTLGALATVAAGTFNITPRIWGDPETPLSRIATATGSASSLVGDVLASGAHALVAGEVRYHDALDALEMGLAIVELGHDVSEWPLVSLLEDAVRSVPGLEAHNVHTLPAQPGWWTP
jgi:putative NIF3 family GTP cyclohydrolase 1 type 2